MAENLTGVHAGGAQTRTFAAAITELRRLCGWAREVCAHAGIAIDDALDLELCLDEMVSNVVRHGGDSARLAPVSVSLQPRGGAVDVKIEDSGRPFDPLLAPVPMTPASLADLKFGGYGVEIVRHLAHDLRHRRDGDRNVLEFTVGPLDGDHGTEPRQRTPRR